MYLYLEAEHEERIVMPAKCNPSIVAGMTSPLAADSYLSYISHILLSPNMTNFTTR